MRRNLSFNNALIALAGFIIGYAPAIVFNFTHHFANWNAVLAKTGGGGFGFLLHADALSQIFFVEMPKFFGADTVLWYYPERPASGLLFFVIALLAAGVAACPFIKLPLKILAAVRGGFTRGHEERDLLLLLLTLACFIPYVTAPFRVPGYFLAGCFFFAARTGRLLKRSFDCSKALVRFGGAAILAAVAISGSALMIDITRHNHIETLTLCDLGENYCITRVPAVDLQGVEDHLRQREVTGVWTTVSFVYPLLFECGETFAVSDAIFGYRHRVYPPPIPWREPSPDGHVAVVIESDSPFREVVEARLKAAGIAPLVNEYGKLAVIEGGPR